MRQHPKYSHFLLFAPHRFSSTEETFLFVSSYVMFSFSYSKRVFYRITFIFMVKKTHQKLMELIRSATLIVLC